MVDVFEESMECAGNIEMNDSGDTEFVINTHVHFLSNVARLITI